MRANQKQYQEAKKAWAERTGEKVIAVRLAAEYRERLDALAKKYGGRREAIEAGISALEKDADNCREGN